MMQFAISGTYYQGQIQLAELPPIDEPSEVVVVFLPKVAQPTPKGKTARLFGMMHDAYLAQDDDIEQELTQLSRQSEQHLLEKWDIQSHD